VARVRFGIYLDDRGPKLGPGKIRLLAGIREHGSISAAARSMDMSYRHAWILLDELNHGFDEPVIVSTMGGSQGGGARLTPWGEELIERFTAIERTAQAAIADHVDALEARAVKPRAPRTRTKRRAKAR